MAPHPRSAVRRPCACAIGIVLLALAGCGDIGLPSAPECGGGPVREQVSSAAAGAETSVVLSCPNGATRQRLTRSRQ